MLTERTETTQGQEEDLARSILTLDLDRVIQAIMGHKIEEVNFTTTIILHQIEIQNNTNHHQI